MVWWRGTRLMALSLIASGVGLGCQTQPDKPMLLNPDFPTLLNMPGSAEAPVLTRAQKPDSSAASSKSPLELGPTDPGSRDTRGARIRAVINGEAILDEEVVAGAYQNLVAAQNEQEKADILNKKLQEIIDREVIMQDAVARLGGKGGERFLKELQKIATKEFDKQWLHRMMRANHQTDVEEFKKFLKNNGMPLHMIRRQWERNFIAMEYMRSRIDPNLNKIGHLQIVQYYQKHGDDMRIEDSLTWQDLFIAAAKHPSRDAARHFAETLLARLRQGEDFVKLAKEFDNGDSSLRENAEGIGHKPGEIRPHALEEPLFRMKQGEVSLIEMEVGYRIVKVTQREYAGKRPFDAKMQKEIKEKLRNEIFQQEMKRIIADLKRKAIIEVANEIK